jgi:hypothetical protein
MAGRARPDAGVTFCDEGSLRGDGPGIRTSRVGRVRLPRRLSGLASPIVPEKRAEPCRRGRHQQRVLPVRALAAFWIGGGSLGHQSLDCGITARRDRRSVLFSGRVLCIGNAAKALAHWDSPTRRGAGSGGGLAGHPGFLDADPWLSLWSRSGRQASQTGIE